MSDYTAIKKNQALRDTYLKTLYQLCDGKFLNGVHLKTLNDELGFSYDEASRTLEHLLQSGLVTFTAFQMATVTELGIAKVEREMAHTYEETEKLILKTLFEKTKDDDVTAADLARLISVKEDDIYYVLKDLNRKGWSEENYEDTARITDEGVTALRKWDIVNIPIVRDFYQTNIHGTSNNQIGPGNIQNVQINNNPEFEKAINGLLTLIQNSNIDDDEKESLTNDVNAVSKLPQKEPSQGLLERFGARIKLLETSLKAAELLGKASAYWPTIIEFYENLVNKK